MNKKEKIINTLITLINDSFISLQVTLCTFGSDSDSSEPNGLIGVKASVNILFLQDEYISR